MNLTPLGPISPRPQAGSSESNAAVGPVGYPPLCIPLHGTDGLGTAGVDNGGAVELCVRRKTNTLELRSAGSFGRGSRSDAGEDGGCWVDDMVAGRLERLGIGSRPMVNGRWSRRVKGGLEQARPFHPVGDKGTKEPRPQTLIAGSGTVDDGVALAFTASFSILALCRSAGSPVTAPAGCGLMPQ